MLPWKALASLTWLTFLLSVAEIEGYWLAPGSRTPIPGLPNRNGVYNPCGGPNDWYQTATRQCFNYVAICPSSRGLKWMRCSHYSSRCMETWKVKPCRSQPYRRQVNGGGDHVSCYFRDFQECWNVATPQQCYALSVCFSVGYGERSNYNTRVGSVGRRLLALDPEFDAPFNLTAARMHFNASVPALQVVEEPFKHVRLPMGMASIN